MKVLLLEDDKQLQHAAVRLLRRTFESAIIVDTVDNAPGAIALLQQNVYDFMLSDFAVIDGTGGDVLIWIRANKPDMVERFVFFSGSNSLNLLHHKVISKGIDVDEFVQRLRQFVPMVLP
jgi:DNA-binding NarL/FixJ family response regulator